MDQADAQVAGHVGCGEHRHDAGLGCGSGRVYRDHIGSGVLGQMHGAVEHAGSRHVVYVELVAHGQVGGLVTGGARADAAGELHWSAVQPVGPCCEHLHRFENLEIAGAAAEMGAEVPGRLVAAESGAVAVDERLGPHHDARSAEAALHRAGRAEGGGVAVALLGTQPLRSDDLGALGFAERNLTCHPGFAVEQHGAAPALS